MGVGAGGMHEIWTRGLEYGLVACLSHMEWLITEQFISYYREQSQTVILTYSRLCPRSTTLANCTSAILPLQVQYSYPPSTLLPFARPSTAKWSNCLPQYQAENVGHNFYFIFCFFLPVCLFAVFLVSFCKCYIVQSKTFPVSLLQPVMSVLRLSCLECLVLTVVLGHCTLSPAFALHSYVFQP